MMLKIKDGGNPRPKKISWNLLFFLVPAIILIIVFFFVPVFLTFLMSFTNMSTATGLTGFKIIGLKNYIQILKSQWTLKILKNTLFYVFTTLSLFNVGTALFLAIFSTHISENAGKFVRTLWLLPRITPSVVYATLWTWFTAEAPYGVLNQFLSPLGISSRNWLMSTPWVFIILINGFVGASFGMLIFTSAIKNIPPDYIMAAQVDGASTFQTIRKVILPMIRWPILFVTTYQTLSLLTSFEYILLTTDGGPGFYTTEVWALYAYHNALSNYYGNTLFGFGAALSVFLVILGIIFSIIYLRVFNFRALISEPKIEV
jgi:inositol-phosphate transport system permease protein